VPLTDVMEKALLNEAVLDMAIAQQRRCALDVSLPPPSLTVDPSCRNARWWLFTLSVRAQRPFTSNLHTPSPTQSSPPSLFTPHVHTHLLTPSCSHHRQVRASSELVRLSLRSTRFFLPWATAMAGVSVLHSSGCSVRNLTSPPPLPC
jgi:hypothetical protein